MNRNRFILVLFGLLFFNAKITLLHAQIIIMDTTSLRDTKLLSDPADMNYGTADTLELDGSPIDESTLLFWDLTHIPPLSTIDSVVITVDVTNLSPAVYQIYEMKRDWVENEATWNIYASGLNWEVPGANGTGDRGSILLGTFSPPSKGLYTTSLSADGVAQVQSWVDNPSSNHGILIFNYANGDGASFYSREGPAGSRPTMTVFYELPTLKLISPNGGEIWEAGSIHNITWNSAGTTSGTVNIEYSDDNGLSWNSISTGIMDDGVEPWTLPQISTSQALVRINDADVNGPSDASDAVFAITPTPLLIIASPNGGEDWDGGTLRNITWNSFGTSGTVKIEFSADNGFSWSNVTASTPDTGSYLWTVPDTSTTEALLRISDTDGGGPSDTSDGVFSITRVIGEPIIFSATGDVPYAAGDDAIFQQQIADQNLYSPSEFFVHLGDIKSQTVACEESIYSKVAGYLLKLAIPVFIVPGDNETTDCQDPAQGWAWWVQYFMNFELNFCGAPVAEKQAARPENFAFVSKGVLFVGINLVSGVSKEIQADDATWVEQQLGQKISEVRGAVIFSQCGPSSSGARATFFSRFVTAAQTFNKPILFLHGDGHVWIEDYPWSTAPNVKRIQVTKGGSEEPLQVTVTMDPRNPQNLFSYIRDPFTNNPQLYNVMPCVEAGPDQQIDIAAAADLQGRVKDDGVPLSPGTPIITWSKISGPGLVTFNNPNDDTTSASFSLPGTYLLRLAANDGELQNYDELMVDVTGVPAATLTVIAPNGGESWEVSSSQSITWSSTGTVSDVKLEYSSNGGTNWNLIIASTPNDGTFLWTVPNDITGNALVRVSDLDDDPTDISDQTFSIVPIPTLTVVTPNGGEQWEVGSLQDINWDSTGSIGGSVKLDYTTDGGTNWNEIIASTTNTGSYGWTIPNDISASVLVRVSDAVDGDPADTSDATFSIVPIPTLTIVSPNGGESWEVGSSQTISWSSVGTSGTVKIEYSADNGTSWNDIATSTPDTGSFPWTIPDTSSTTVLVAISDVDGNGPVDTSDAVFTLSPTPTPTLTILTPNGGERWPESSIHNITWSSVSTSGAVKIMYSVDDGLNWNDISVSTPDTGSYPWTIPNTTTLTGLLAISDVSNSNTADTSAAFKISTESNTQSFPTGDSPYQQFGQTGIAMDFINSPGGDVTVNYFNIFAPELLTNMAISKHWDITSSMPDGSFLTDAEFSYQDSDTIGLDESLFIPAYWDTSSSSWVAVTDFTLDETNNKITVHNLDHFTIFAIGEPEAFGISTTVDVKVFLEGPFNSDSMLTTLQSSGYIPLSQPYSGAPWNYTGTESVTSIPVHIVDWVLVELRSSTEASSTVATRAAFLKSDGSVVDLDGSSPVKFETAAGEYYICIHHRNHLSIMSASTHSISSSSALYDFTASLDSAYTSGTAAMKDLGGGVYGMFSGDGNHSGIVTIADRNDAFLLRDGVGYLDEDYNLSGIVTISDVNEAFLNRDASTQVPN